MALSRFVTQIFAAGLVGMALGAAALGQAFTVSGVRIDAEASTALDAQRTALAEGQTRAARALINRMTLPEDRLEADLAPISADVAAELIAGLQISDEQRSATRYRAIITVDFDPRAVRRYFDQAGLPFVQSQAAPVLVVPVSEGADGAALSTAGWYDAWAMGGYRHALTPFVPLSLQRSPDGRLLSPPPVSTQQALSLDSGALEALADSYGVNAVAVIRARAGADGVRIQGDILRFTAEGSSVEPLPVVAAPDFNTAAGRLVGRFEDDWKRASIVRSGDTAELDVTVLFNSLREWKSLQSAVAGASLVQNARLDALSRSGAAMTLTYRGDREQVRAELAARGAIFAEEPGLGWTVRGR